MNSIHAALYKAGLIRTSEGKIIGGVCSGLAHKLGVDVWPMRLLVFLLLVLVPGSPLLLYPIMWIAMPDETYRPALDSSPTYPQDRLHD